MKFSKFLTLPKWVQLLPLLLFYLLLIIVWKLPTETAGDEGRYLNFTNNLLNGFYSPEMPNINLWNGPGFPIFLMPFVYLKFKLIQIRLINGFLLYISLIFTYSTCNLYFDRKLSFFVTLITGLYFPSFQMLRFIHTETLTWLIFSVVIYLSSKDLKKYSVYLGVLIGLLCLVKVIFVYVILICIIIAVFSLFLKKTSKSMLPSTIKILVIAFVVFIPYLVYCQNLTHKFFYFTNSGGLSLYTMSSTDENEFGDWDVSVKFKELQNHQLVYNKIQTLNPIEKDSFLKQSAITNIKNYPVKYLKNWSYNVSRMIVEYPYSYVPFSKKILVYMIPGLFAIICIMYSLGLYFRKFIHFDSSLFYLTLFFLVYLGISSLLSAYGRMFFITIPFWTFFVARIKFGIKNLPKNHL